MKHILITICFGLFMIQSCKKPTEKTEISNAIIGAWELRHTSAAMMPNGTSYPAGNGNILKFTDSTYEKLQNGQVIKSGSYLTTPDTTVEESICLVVAKGTFTNRLIYDNNFSSTKVFIHIADNRLSFTSGCYVLDGGHMEVYERINTND